MALILTQWSFVNCQTISRKSISNSGGTMNGGGFMITFNIGETVIPTLSAGGAIITEGFEQPGEQIQLGIISTTACAGGTFNVPFTAADLLATNIYTAQLSDATGSFASPINIGTLAGNSNAGTIITTIPANTPSGIGYKIRIMGSVPLTISVASADITILNPPTPVSTGGTIYNGQSISITATGCTGTLGTFTLKWYQTSDNLLVTMPVSPVVTTQYYSKCEQTVGLATCLSPKSNDATVTVVNRVFVNIANIAAPVQNGNSWATAYGNLQTGLAAATPAVEVWVAKGTYKPTTTTTRTIYFEIPNNVIVYGGFAGTEDYLIDRNFRTNISILSGDIGTLNIDTDNSYHVVVMNASSNTTVLDGFTITGGYANFDPKRIYNAPLAVPTTATIETGGGILVQNAGTPTIANCNIIQNAAVMGGGLYAGDASLPNVLFCKFMANQAGFGAGFYFQDGSNGKVGNTLISGNKGIGGVYNNNSNPMFTNVTFAGNGGYNGGIFNANSQPVVKNAIIWGNSTPFNDTQSIITYSTIQSGYAGVGNLSMDPKFVSQTPEGLAPILSGDYHVQAASLTIDRGDNGTISLTDKDLDGNLRRFSGGRVDMGAYEFQGAATTTLVISAQTGDWESNSTWVGFKVPELGDYVIIDANHIVTINTTAIAKGIEYQATGQVKFKTAVAKLNIGF
jgi:Right handed beta helix region